MTYVILQGNCLDVLKTIPSSIIQTCVTSPPYFGLRDYNVAGQLGLEATPQAYVDSLVSVFREVRRTLRDDGTCWLNLGDSYARAAEKGGSGPNGKNEDRWGYGEAKSRIKDQCSKQASNRAADIDGIARHLTLGSSDGAVGRADRPGSRSIGDGLKPKDLIGIPWRVAFALQADGWYLRQDIIWAKPNPMPESVRDRCTKAHEYIFLLSKSEKYWFDGDAIRQDPAPKTFTHRGGGRGAGKIGQQDALGKVASGNFGNWDKPRVVDPRGVNKRSVWTVSPRPFKEAHFATFPPELIKPCILAGAAQGKLVLDPFGGAGTTALVSESLGRHSISIELNPGYVTMAKARVEAARPLPIAAE